MSIARPYFFQLRSAATFTHKPRNSFTQIRSKRLQVGDVISGHVSGCLAGGLAEQKEVCGGVGRVVGGILRTVGVGMCVLARSRRVDSREVDVGIDGAESDAQANQHQQNY